MAIIISIMIVLLSGMMVIKKAKAKSKEELLPIAWHPSRHWDWCMSEDEKRRWK